MTSLGRYVFRGLCFCFAGEGLFGGKQIPPHGGASGASDRSTESQKTKPTDSQFQREKGKHAARTKEEIRLPKKHPWF